MKEIYGDYCKACYIRVCKPSKGEIKRMVMTPYQGKCDKCGKMAVLVDYIEFQDNKWQ